MNLKQFLKPDWRKIVLTIILSLIVYFFLWFNNIACVREMMTGHCMGASRKLEDIFIRYLQPQNFLAILILWYLFSCLITWIYDKVKKKS